MKNNLIEIKWDALINDKNYGSIIAINSVNPTNEEISDIMSVVCTQIKYSLQTIINGKTE